MHPGSQIGLGRNGIQEGLCELSEVVHVGKVGCEAQRNSNSTTALHPQVGKKLIPGHAFFALKELRKDFVRLAAKDVAEFFLRNLESSFASTRVTEAACTQREREATRS